MDKNSLTIWKNYIFILQPCLYLFFLINFLGNVYFNAEQLIIVLNKKLLVLFWGSFIITFSLIFFLHIPQKINRSLIIATLVISNIIYITALYLTSNLESMKLLFLFPMLIAAIELSYLFNYVVFAIIGVIILSANHLFGIDDAYLWPDNLILLIVFFALMIFMKRLLDKGKMSREHLISSHQKLSEQEQLLNQLLDDFLLPTIIVDAQNIVLMINQAALQSLKIENRLKSKIIGCNLKELIEESTSINKYSTDQRLAPQSEDQIIIDDDNLQLQFFPVFGVHNEILFQVAVLMEMGNIEFTKERARQIEEINAMGEMAAGIAHEIKNPLGSVRGFLQLAQIQQEPLSEENINLLLEEIERCFSIVSHFVMVKDIEQKDKTLVNLKKLIEKHIALIEKNIYLKGLKLKLNLTDVPDLLLNADQIRQLFLNLTTNSMEAMDDQGILTIGLINNVDEVILTVQDTGSGISAEMLSKLGTPFFTTKKKGTGIGFNICQQIAQSNNARIKVESEMGIGTVISVIFVKNEV